MRRLLGVLAVALLAVAVPAHAQDKKGAEKKAAGKTMTAVGEVTAVTASSLTVKGKDGEWTFDVDKDTEFLGKGVSGGHIAEQAEPPGSVDQLSGVVGMGVGHVAPVGDPQPGLAGRRPRHQAALLAVTSRCTR